MVPWTLISLGKPTKMALETRMVGVSCRPEAQWGGGGYRSGSPLHGLASPLAGEFWLGLEKVHRILGDRGSRLAVQLQDWEGNAESLQFPVHLGGEDTAYSLKLTPLVASKLGATTFSPSGLSLPFSTWDQDHDLRGDKNCARSLSGKQALSLPILPFPTQLFCIPAPPSTPSISTPLFFWLRRVLVEACGIQFPDQNQTCASCIGSVES